jgi:hypothetical protein
MSAHIKRSKKRSAHPVPVMSVQTFFMIKTDSSKIKERRKKECQIRTLYLEGVPAEETAAERPFIHSYDMTASLFVALSNPSAQLNFVNEEFPPKRTYHVLWKDSF